MRLYLAHSINERHWIRKKELEIEKETGIELVNPFYDLPRPEIIEIDAGKKSPMGDDLDFVNIVNQDLLHIYESNGVLAFIGENPSIGTSCELWFTLSIGGRPIYIVSKKYTTHPWIKYMVKVSNGKTFNNFEEFINFIKVN